MSTIHNSMEYYQSNQGLLSMLNSKKSGNALIDRLSGAECELIRPEDTAVAMDRAMEKPNHFKQ